MPIYHGKAGKSMLTILKHFLLTGIDGRKAIRRIAQPQPEGLRSSGLGAAPQQAEKPFVLWKRNGWFFAFVIQMHCLLLLYQTNLFDMDAGKLHDFTICRFAVSLCQSLSITLLHSLSLCKPCALWMPELFCFIHIETFAIY